MVGKLSAEGLHGQFDFITMAGDETISYDGRGVPFGSNDAGKAVAITGNMTVGLAGTGDEIYGVLIRVEADKTVNVGKGKIQEFTYGGTAPEAGQAILAADGGDIAGAAVGTAASTGVVVDVDTVNTIAWVDLK